MGKRREPTEGTGESPASGVDVRVRAVVDAVADRLDASQRAALAEATRNVIGLSETLLQVPCRNADEPAARFAAYRGEA